MLNLPYQPVILFLGWPAAVLSGFGHYPLELDQKAQARTATPFAIGRSERQEDRPLDSALAATALLARRTLKFSALECPADTPR